MRAFSFQFFIVNRQQVAAIPGPPGGELKTDCRQL
jgi:hypothetical protein